MLNFLAYCNALNASFAKFICEPFGGANPNGIVGLMLRWPDWHPVASQPLKNAGAASPEPPAVSLPEKEQPEMARGETEAAPVFPR